MPLHVETKNVQPNTKSITSPGRNTEFTPPVFSRHNSTADIDAYFHGPRNIQAHSKWPLFMRMRGSVMPKLILPLTFVGIWTTAVTVISKFVHKLAVDSVLLTVLGFLVGLGLSFRSSTAYERYNDGRKYWSQLLLSSRNMARLIWIHSNERFSESPELGKSDLINKISALNLLNAFAVALKHRLRFEPSTEYPDLEPLIAHLDTFAARADHATLRQRKPHPFKAAGQYLGVSFAESNPRKLIKKSKDNLGNLPLEILNHLSAYMEHLFATKQMTVSVHQTWAMNNIGSLSDVLTGAERVLNTPLPIAYSISISQITWAYVMVLPFQLVGKLEWITIPATIVAAYIILGLHAIGREIENPFGEDVNDLPLDDYCRELASEIDALMAAPAPDPMDFFNNSENKILYPLSFTGAKAWSDRSVEDIRSSLKDKATTKSASVMIMKMKTMDESNMMEV